MASSRKWNDLTKRVENVQRGMSDTNVELKKRKDVKKTRLPMMSNLKEECKILNTAVKFNG